MEREQGAMGEVIWGGQGTREIAGSIERTGSKGDSREQSEESRKKGSGSGYRDSVTSICHICR
jgi:hypothetical protein